MKKRNSMILIIGFIVSLMIISLPILSFYLKFKNQGLSNSLTDWATFGDYIGGSVNTIISFLSLIILGYLTYIVSKESISENKKMNLLMKRLDSYNELTYYIPKINLFAPTMNRMIASISKDLDNLEILDDESFKKKKDLTIKNLILFSEFHYFLFSFNVRFGHLYKYDFNSEEFELLLESSNQIHEFFEQIINLFELDKPYDSDKMNPNFTLLFERLADVINSLRTELE